MLSEVPDQHPIARKFMKEMEELPDEKRIGYAEKEAEKAMEKARAKAAAAKAVAVKAAAKGVAKVAAKAAAKAAAAPSSDSYTYDDSEEED